MLVPVRLSQSSVCSINLPASLALSNLPGILDVLCSVQSIRSANSSSPSLSYPLTFQSLLSSLELLFLLLHLHSLNIFFPSQASCLPRLHAPRLLQTVSSQFSPPVCYQLSSAKSLPLLRIHLLPSSLIPSLVFPLVRYYLSFKDASGFVPS